MKLKRLKYSFVDLYAGPGGFSAGFELTGLFEPVFAVDKDHAAATTYRENRKHLQVHVAEEDVTHIKTASMFTEANRKGFKGVDVILAGPPCRPYSNANRNKENRWNGDVLPNEFVSLLDIVEDLKPKFVVIENVATLGGLHEGRIVKQILAKFEQLGYRADYDFLEASDFGVPQRRRRIFVAAVSRRIDKGGRLLPATPEDPTETTVRDAIGDLQPIRYNKIVKCSQSGWEELDYPETHCLSDYATVLRMHSAKIFNHRVHVPKETVRARFKYIGRGEGLRDAWKKNKIPEELILNSYSSETKEKMHTNIYRRLAWDEPSWTITHVRKALLIHPDKRQDRLLSVREAARIQSFMDSYRFYGSLTQQYQQVADAVPPLLGKRIAIHTVPFLQFPLNQERAALTG
jgi:DNA (cytosine-5)-methyltransferase 1